MNIDKAKMRDAYYNRNDKQKFRELVDYFYELANFFANKAGISSFYKEDYVQFAVERACKKLDLYNPKHINSEEENSAVFSYFYKIIYINIRYCMRETRQKKEKFPNTCSFEAISAIIEDSHSEDNIITLTEEEDNNHIIIDGKVFEKQEVLEALRQAKKMLKAAEKNADFVLDTDNENIALLFNKLKNKKCSDEEKKQIKKEKKSQKIEA